MNKEKELLLKLLMEKYEGEDLDDDYEESKLGCDYGSYGGSKYEIVEPEVWEELDLDDLSSHGVVGSMERAVFNITQTECVMVRISSYNYIEFSFKGGDPKLIAEALWVTKIAGIGLKGDLTVMIKDGFGRERSVSFNYEYA